MNRPKLSIIIPTLNEEKNLPLLLESIKKQEFKDYEIKPFQVFEAKDLDNGENFIERDFQAFLHHQEVYKWDKLTDPYTVGADW